MLTRQQDIFTKMTIYMTKKQEIPIIRLFCYFLGDFPFWEIYPKILTKKLPFFLQVKKNCPKHKAYYAHVSMVSVTTNCRHRNSIQRNASTLRKKVGKKVEKIICTVTQ